MNELTITLTEQDVKNVLALIYLAPIKGAEAQAVSELAQKFVAVLPKEEEKK